MVSHEKSGDILQFEILKNEKHISHFNTTLKGGVSSDSYRSFNLGLYSGDMPGKIIENRNILSNILSIPLKNLFIPYQVHGSRIRVIQENHINNSYADNEKLLYGIDALITEVEKVCICISTADCVPLLIYDPVKRVIAAVHAGWRGTALKIVTKVIEQMKDKYGSFPGDMLACIGPSISSDHFEVGLDVVEVFEKAGFYMDRVGHKNDKTGKWHIDLWEANKLQLIDMGLQFRNIEIAQLCTFSNPDLFFSARRQTIYSGRMLTGIMLV